MPPVGSSATDAGAADLHKARLAGLRLVRQGGLTTKAFAERFKISYAQARYFILNRGVSRRSGPKPFFSPEEESLLVKYLIFNAKIGRGLSTEAL